MTERKRRRRPAETPFDRKLHRTHPRTPSSSYMRRRRWRRDVNSAPSGTEIQQGRERGLISSASPNRPSSTQLSPPALLRTTHRAHGVLQRLTLSGVDGSPSTLYQRIAATSYGQPAVSPGCPGYWLQSPHPGSTSYERLVVGLPTAADSSRRAPRCP
ncbi:hypothetical protein FKP32DRAFT_1305413 [Trametes sanguinea]|nr:hypothetical protein FKP32DRAFT_1305413 [Trametes sanguinea]